MVADDGRLLKADGQANYILDQKRSSSLLYSRSGDVLGLKHADHLPDGHSERKR